MTTRLPSASAGLGLRRALLDDLRGAPAGTFDFLECAPDNWIGVGGRLGDALHDLSSQYPLTCHGLSLSLGGMAPLDDTFLARTRRFLDQHDVVLYSEHLSYCADDGHLYDLMPIPFTEEAVHHVAARIRQAQDALGRRIAVENVSYYAAPYQAMAEADFIDAVLEEADCDLLLDVNNVYVNSVNHGFDAQRFIDGIPAAAVGELHLAGFTRKQGLGGELLIDSHDQRVDAAVWALYGYTLARLGAKPTLIEWDQHLPDFAVLEDEARLATEHLDVVAALAA